MSESTKNYKTRTILNERKSPSVDEKWGIALDIGYSAVKGISPNTVYSFPSYARKLSGPMINGVNVRDEEILYKGEKGDMWIVGEIAQKMVASDESNDSETALFGRHRYFTPMFQVIAKVGLGMGMLTNNSGDPNKKAIYVQTGLPPKYMGDKEDLIESLCGEHNFQIKIGNNPWQRISFSLTEQQIFVMQQPMGTFCSISKDSNGEWVKDATKYIQSNILIFDPGFGTLDVFHIQNRQPVNKDTFDDLGMKRVFQEVLKDIHNEYQVNIPITNMQKMLESGTFRKFNRKKRKQIEIPFDEILEKNAKKVCLEALERLDTSYNYLSDMDYLVITGGTGAAWSQYIREYYKDIDTLEIISGNQNDNLPYIFSNVRGYYMFLLEVLQRSK